MTCRVLGVAVLGAALSLVAAQDAAAFGKKSAGCGVPCGVYAGACGPTQTVTYVDKTVTCLRPEWKSRKVDVDVVTYKMVDEPFKYKVCVPVVRKDKVKVCEYRQVNEPYKYTVYVPTQVTEKVKVCETTWTTKDEPYTWYECVPTTTKQKRLVCETVCVPTVVTCTVPVSTCGHRGGWLGRCCGGAPACADPCAFQTVSHTVLKRTVVTREVEVDVCTWAQVKKDGVRKVSIPTPVWVEKDVTCVKCLPVVKDGVRVVCVPTWVEKDVDVCTHTWADKDGVRQVCRPFTTKQTIDQPYCEWVKVETVVKVPVVVPCAAPAPCGPYAAGCGGCAPVAACCR